MALGLDSFLWIQQIVSHEKHMSTQIGTASVNPVEFNGVRPQMYIEDQLW